MNKKQKNSLIVLLVAFFISSLVGYIFKIDFLMPLSQTENGRAISFPPYVIGLISSFVYILAVGLKSKK